MNDGPATATLIAVTILFGGYALFALVRARFEQRAGARLTEAAAVHWVCAQDEWQRYCDRQRDELWTRSLRPAMRTAVPAAAFVIGLAVILELRSRFVPGAATLLTLAFALLVANTLIGPWLRAYRKLSRRRRLGYELFVSARGVLERWSDAGGVREIEAHLYEIADRHIERVEANGIDPSEIVFAIAQPLAFGFLRTEERFLVPAGELAKARELAHRLTPRRDADPNRHPFGPGAHPE